MAKEDQAKQATYNDKITARDKDFSQWYLDVIAAADLAEYAPVRGCMVIKPYGYALWEAVQQYLDKQFKATGVQNAYFPLFIPEKLLKQEAEHVEGFAPEVALVTHAGGKKLEEPLVIRPTSETVMYEVFSKWIQSYRDLPLLINQWANVVRWEMRPRLFLRTIEFLWQEGHTVHASEQEADQRSRDMLEIYRVFAEDFLAMPVISGMKSDSEKFAGAKYTYAIEAMMQDGKALQFATSHNLGQNFAKVFNVKYLDQNSQEQFAWQTSWGLSTRTIGGLIMAHGDDQGLVLPPKIAPIQVVIVTISTNDEQAQEVKARAQTLANELDELGVRTHIDDREARPGEKYYHWEKRGVPLRIELGPKDLVANEAPVVRRDTGDKQKYSLSALPREVNTLLEQIQQNLYDSAKKRMDAKIKEVDTWEQFRKEIEAGNFVLAHWCGDAAVEAEIKEVTMATIRCIPFDQKKEKGKCIKSGKPSAQRVLFAKAY